MECLEVSDKGSLEIESKYMSIRNKFLPYALRVMRGDVRARQLLNLARSRILGKGQTVSWQPTHLSIFVTDRCNFHCDMCPAHSTKIPESYVHRHRAAPEMSLNLFRYIVDRYPNLIRVELIGTGEPLLNLHFFDMVTESIKRRMIVNAFSNGYSLDAYIPNLIRSGLDRLCVSLNGHTAKEFHRMTGNPEEYYSRILRNVETLVQARNKERASLQVELSFIIDRYNYRYMKEMIEVGETLGADSVIFLHFQATPFNGFTPEERCIYAGDPAVREELAALASRKYRCDVTWPYLLRDSGDARSVCRWPFSILQVDGNGNIGGCPMQLLNMHENGKVYDKDAWNNDYFRDLRRRHLVGDVFWPCKSCVESGGIDPILAVKAKRPFRIRKRGRTQNAVVQNEKKV